MVDPKWLADALLNTAVAMFYALGVGIGFMLLAELIFHKGDR